MISQPCRLPMDLHPPPPSLTYNNKNETRKKTQRIDNFSIVAEENGVCRGGKKTKGTIGSFVYFGE